ncbi:carbon-phosphorus lyase complex subunit PhnI [Allopusillimonas ginsengisoli]|uniref:carbon-phosphorus lyase complex subunit PhnI n=1 Tax=Allopusillimonas ginsengisoli TaxID=453575 RepID=UPI0010200D2A|nr:carbon-phosphorus lyase complex subunit PhnI [Allopusillimonas ginsengisoli]TEA77277.1 carbon-phosphorus lyase complex subunit PhnI [Allopusillimonas ginsengisoli]
MYVAVKGGEKAIDNAHALLAARRRGDPAVPELSVAQLREQMPLAVARIMSEGSLFDPELAALALKQAAGDMLEAIFLLRAYRTTLPRFMASVPLNTGAMRAERRISATFKDLPGGQVLGPTFDYTHRLLDFTLLRSNDSTPCVPQAQARSGPAQPIETDSALPRVASLLAKEGLLGRESDSHGDVPDITRDPLDFPTTRPQRLQALARGDEGFLLALGYSTQRGYGRNHPFAGEIRVGQVEVWIEPEELGFAVPIGDIEVTECEMINQFVGSKTQPPQFTRGYGLAFGNAERKAMGMALVDRALRASEYQEDVESPAQQEEFVLMHCDNVEAAGFVSHLKLPHYVDFQSELDLIRKLRRAAATKEKGETPAVSTQEEQS